MHSRLLALGALLIFAGAESALHGQYPGGYPPGGYPPGGYPGGVGYPRGRAPGGGLPFPRKGKQKKETAKESQEKLQSLTGMLRRLDEKSVVIEAQDTRILNIRRSESTRFFKDGEDLKPASLQPGDHLIVEARQDDEGFYYAVNVILQRQGTAAERAEASEPVQVSTQASENDDDRPVLRRKDSPSQEKDSPSPEAAEARAAGAEATPAPPARPASNADAGPPAARRENPAPAPVPARGPAPPSSPRGGSEGAPGAALPPPPSPGGGGGAPETTPSQPVYDANVEVIPAPAGAAASEPLDDDDSGPPQLRRGKPAPRKSAPRQVAVNRPPAPPPSGEAAPAPTGAAPPRPAVDTAEAASRATPRPEFRTAAPAAPASANPPDPVIEKARAEAATFTDSLPNYVCQEQIARFVNTSHVVDWRPLDIVSAEVVYENGRESYRNLAINSKPVKKKMEELSGSWSTGEFATVLMDLFSPATAAEFRFRNESKSGGRAALRYDFDVERENSHWHINVASQSVVPAYKGSIWIDKETKRALRIEMQAYRLPSEFPLDKVESATDYEYVRISDRQFLLPVHAETLMCQSGTNLCSRNVIDFRNYHKYSGEATITFGK